MEAMLFQVPCQNEYISRRIDRCLCHLPKPLLFGQ